MTLSLKQFAYLAVAVIFFLIGALAGPWLMNANSSGKSLTSGLSKTSGTYQDGWDAAKKRLEEGGFYGAALPGMEMKTVSGQVQAVKDGQLTIKIRPLEPLADPELDIRTVKINKDTKVVINKQKDQAVYEQEMREFQDKMKATGPAAIPGQAGDQATAPLMPPSPMTEETVEFSTVKTGDNIIVSASTDVRDLKIIEAAKILVMSAPTMATPAPIPPAPSAGGAGDLGQ